MRNSCARCSKPRKDVRLISYLICSYCRTDLSKEAFNGAKPSFSGGAFTSYCALCNQMKRLALTQWLLCPFCANVVYSYRIGSASQEFAKSEWNRVVKPAVPHIDLVAADPIELRPYSLPPRGKKRIQATTLDFRGEDTQLVTPIFWVEVKSGQSTPAEMSAFQLDCTDCDDIINCVRVSGLPALVFHVQRLFEPHPPAEKISPVGVWWVDMFALAASFDKVHKRTEGSKPTALFKGTAFNELETLGPVLARDYHIELLNRMATDGVPSLYKS